MATSTTSLIEIPEDRFQTTQITPIAGSHLIHDIYSSFLYPLLPVLIKKLSLTLTQVGWLNAALQLPSLLNPFIGYLADKVSLHYFIILAPAVTATLVSSIGFASDYYALMILLFAVGISIAAFHAPAPAMIAQLSGRKVGLGMSLFMAAGELARTIGPLVAVWAVSTWTLDGFYRVVVLGWAASLILFWRLRKVPSKVQKPGSIRVILPLLKRLFLPLIVINLFRNFMLETLTTYLPTYMSQRGATLWVAGSSLSILELAGACGALASGTISDRLGRKTVLGGVTVLSTGLMVVFLSTEGWLLFPLLVLLGFTTLSATPVMLALVQEQMPNNRAVGNGLFMILSFLLRSVATLAIGILGDRFGLQPVYFWSAILSLFAIPAIIALPQD